MPVLKIKKEDGTWQEVWGAVNTGSGGAPKLTSVTMLANAWQGEGNLFQQAVTCNGTTANSKLDPQPSPEQVIALQNAGISLMLSNNNGIVTAWALNGKPVEDLNMSVLITEVTVV